MENPSIVEKFQLTEESAIEGFYCICLEDTLAKNTIQHGTASVALITFVPTCNIGQYTASENEYHTPKISAMNIAIFSRAW